MAALIHRKRKADANQSGLVKAFQRLGCHVVDLSAVGKGCPDLLVTRAGHPPCLVEIKNKSGRNRYTPAQLETFAAIHMPIYTLRDVDDVLLLIRGEKQPVNVLAG
jgi:hypothetical protein